MNKLIIALDNMDLNEVKNFIKTIYSWNIKTEKIVLKVNDLLADIWLEWIKNLLGELKNEWIDTSKIAWMLDGKWNDIPNTLWNYLEKLAKSWIENVEFLTIMASGWSEMIKKVMMKKQELWIKTKILAVTVFTSMDDNEAFEVYEDNVKNNILKLAKLALENWIDWLVCSPNDTLMLREIFWSNFELVTPWIRLKDSNIKNDDQERINTPSDAIKNGSTHLVVWRPITWSENKIEVINQILSEVENVKYLPEKTIFAFEKAIYNWTWEDILKYIWAIYLRGENWKYVRLTSKVISDWYINVWVAERNFRVLQKAWNEIRKNILKNSINADLVMWAQMWSVRFSSFLAKSLWIEESVYTEKTWDLNEEMALKRHDVELNWRKVILCEDVVTKWSTIAKMIEIVNSQWWEVVWVASIVNRTGWEDFDGIPLFYCYKPKPFNMFYDEKTPPEQIWNAKPLESWSLICEKPKNAWWELVLSMR